MNSDSDFISRKFLESISGKKVEFRRKVFNLKVSDFAMRLFSLFSFLLLLDQVYCKPKIDTDIFDSTVLDHLAVEIRTALDYQTNSIATNLQNLVRALRDELISNEVMPQILRTLQDIGVIKEELRSTRRTLADLQSQILTLNSTLLHLKKETKKLRKDSKSLKTESQELVNNLVQETGKRYVYFDAIRNKEFTSPGNLTFSSCLINEGGGMNATTGYFTAPHSGIYFFTFHANTVKGNDGLVLLRHNGIVLAGAYDTDNFKHNTLAQATLATLEQGDQVWIDVLSGGVRSNDNLYIHFIGILLQRN